MRTKHYSIQTEKTYLLWIKRFIIFNHKRHPEALGEQEVTDFLTYLAVKRRVTSSTQNLALCAIVFMYKHVFERELTLLPDSIRARAPKRVPTVLSHEEALNIISPSRCFTGVVCAKQSYLNCVSKISTLTVKASLSFGVKAVKTA